MNLKAKYYLLLQLNANNVVVGGIAWLSLPKATSFENSKQSVLNFKYDSSSY